MLQGYGAETFSKDEEGWTALHYACSSKFQNVDNVRMFVKEYGADINGRTQDNETPLDIALRTCGAHSEISRFLTANGATGSAPRKEEEAPNSSRFDSDAFLKALRGPSRPVEPTITARPLVMSMERGLYNCVRPSFPLQARRINSD